MTKQDFIRAVQDGKLPYEYNSMVINILFEEMSEMDFFSLAKTIHAFRSYIKKYDGVTLPKTPDPKKYISMNYAKY